MQGPRVRSFEEKTASLLGRRFGVAVSSGTAALHLALLALGVGPGDEVILPALSFMATSNVVEWVGAKPRFCDISLSTFNLDPEHLTGIPTGKAKAIMPVHEFGLTAPMEEIDALARRSGLTVVEDAACALGAQLREKPAGAFGELACFSFHPRKVLTTGEGGLIAGDDSGMEKTLRALRNHGIQPDETALAPGLNYRLTDLQAALGEVQLTRLEPLVKERRQIAAWYREALAPVPWLALPEEPAGARHTYQTFACRVRKEETAEKSLASARRHRDRLISQIAGKGIQLGLTAQALHALPYFREKYGLQPQDFPRAWEAQETSFALPIYPGMTASAVEEVAEAVQASSPE